ncbi:MAG TPA: hypothetical protein VM911_18545 [Pyrinomonadaceae bacterium]|nr:hypothetical protein [Pyrinomonadaceae bacterium]
MTNRLRIIPTIIAAALVALFLPVMASAQGNYDPWNRNRDNRYGYNNRTLRDSIRRVSDRADDFRDHLDSALDRSRIDDTRREDRINNIAGDFENAADRLRDRFNDGRDLNRSAGEARRLLDIGARIDQFMSRNRVGGRAVSDWAQIRQDLRVISNAYNYNGVYNDPYYRGNDGYYGNDDYRRREEQRRREEEQRRRQRSRIGNIIRNLP